MRCALVVLGLIVGVGCHKPASSTGSVRLPRGHEAYGGETQATTESLGSAPDGSVVEADGSSRNLQSTWEASYSIVVFYRGFW